jgi:hypothetical protein
MRKKSFKEKLKVFLDKKGVGKKNTAIGSVFGGLSYPIGDIRRDLHFAESKEDVINVLIDFQNDLLEFIELN